MEMSKNYRTSGIRLISAVLLAIAFLAGTPAFSQVNGTEEEQKEFRFSDEELLSFFDINQEISVLQRETQERIGETVREHGLTLERFNQIAQAAQIGALQGGMYTEEEISAFNEVAPRITEIQREMQRGLQDVIAEHGLTSQRYQEILNDYRTDQDLQAHVREILRERARQQIREAREQERAQQSEEEPR